MPVSQNLAQEATHISNYFGKFDRQQHSLEEVPHRKWLAVVQDMDETHLDRRLGTDERGEVHMLDIVGFAVHIAHVLLAGAIQKNYVEFSFFPSPWQRWSSSEEQFHRIGSWLLNPLLSPANLTVSAFDYFRSSLSYFKGG